MITYGYRKNGKLLEGGKAYGLCEYLLANGYVLLTKNGDSQKYYFLNKEISEGNFDFKTTTSYSKVILFQSQGWELIQLKGSKEIPVKYRMVEVIVHT